jgi:hypothetical protein
MGVFDDKKFEQLDWMTQITEIIESELNGLLARLPDRIEYSARRVGKAVGTYGHFSISIDSVIRELLREHGSNLAWDEEHKIIDCFQWETTPDIEYNAATGELTGSIALIKTVPTLSDEDLQKMMGLKGIDKVRCLNLGDAAEWNLERINEILDVLSNCEGEKRNRSYRKKMNRIEQRLREIFNTNEWRIRDMELANRIGDWIVDYIEHGNLAALTNLCKLKIMTHNNMPIYSMEEEK